MGAVPGVRGVTVGTAVGRVCAGAVETPRPLCPARPRRGTRPGDATRGRDSRPRGHTHRKMFAAVLFIKARGHEAAQPGPEELVT